MSCGIFIKENIVKMGDYKNEKYPVGALKPKAETNVLSFLQKYPEYNGKDTIIAILGKLFLHKKMAQRTTLFNYRFWCGSAGWRSTKATKRRCQSD